MEREEKKKCSIEGCESEVKSWGWCNKHYVRWRKHGDPLFVHPDHLIGATNEERFWSKVEKTSSCWNWLGKITGRPGSPLYGVVNIQTSDGPKQVSAHKFSYEILVAPLPVKSGLVRCENQRCVNPEHMKLSTPSSKAENEKRFWQKVEKTAYCWNWTGSMRKKEGKKIFGLFKVRTLQGEVSTTAHKFAYEAVVGSIPEDHELYRTCRNPACVNPSHIALLTHSEIMKYVSKRNGDFL